MAVAFADSSIVVLALPDLYGAFNTSIVGVSWVITSYNLVVAVAAAALVAVRAPARRRDDGAQVGLVLFTVASIGCAASWSLPALIVVPLRPGARRARSCWRRRSRCSAASLGSRAAGRQALDERWPCSARRSGRCSAACSPSSSTGGRSSSSRRRSPRVALLATVARRGAPSAAERPGGEARGALAADAALGFVFAALVGALFLAVLLVITVWGLEPIAGALVVSALPAATLAARPARPRASSRWQAVAGGALLLAAGLVALALLPRVSNAARRRRARLLRRSGSGSPCRC